MSLASYYRQLGLRTGATYQDVKLAYRNLARLYHPDVNPDDLAAKEKFIQVTQAYRVLASTLQPQVSRGVAVGVEDSREAGPSSSLTTARTIGDRYPASSPGAERDHSVGADPNRHQDGEKSDHQFKQQFFEQLCDFLKQGRFPRAIALVEGLYQRLPRDPEVGQWYATTYYRWGHDLIERQQYAKAEACLKKSMRADPHNKSLQKAIQRDLLRLGEALSELAEPDVLGKAKKAS